MVDRDILVVDRKILFSEKYFEGFAPAVDLDFEVIILKNFQWIKRTAAEINVSFKQPVGYVVIYKPTKKEIFLYRRNRKHDELRLNSKWSCGVGGHIEKADAVGYNPITESSMREIEEEVEISGGRYIQVLGYINDDSDEVGKVHFGIIYLLSIDYKASVLPRDPEIAEGKLVPIDILEEKCNANENVENWTKIAIKALKNGYK
jgi:predicted NUDIX family phosphoesterase